MTIVNLRGTSGSGKSNVARQLMESGAAEISLAPYTALNGANRFVTGYFITDLSLIVVGPYKVMAGGCDRIWTQDQVCESIRLAARQAKNVFFEGLLVSGIFSRYLALSKELGGMTWAFMDTPVETCIARVRARTAAGEFKTEKLIGKFQEVERVRAKAQAAGERIAIIPHAPDPAAAVRGLFQ